jgi:hypothetical protein
MTEIKKMSPEASIWICIKVHRKIDLLDFQIKAKELFEPIFLTTQLRMLSLLLNLVVKMRSKMKID